MERMTDAEPLFIFWHKFIQIYTSDMITINIPVPSTYLQHNENSFGELAKCDEASIVSPSNI